VAGLRQMDRVGMTRCIRAFPHGHSAVHLARAAEGGD
jgi:hypothetical protein